MTPSSLVRIEKDIEAFLLRLAEAHTPVAVRVFVTMNEGGQSYGKSFGSGDFYSMIGYVSEWLDIQRERSRIETRNQEAKPADGGVA